MADQSGLNANDADLVLLGALPACLLALVVDFVLGKVENALTPEGLKPVDQITNRTKAERKRRTVMAACLPCPDPGSSMFRFCIQCVPEKRRENRNWQ